MINSIALAVHIVCAVIWVGGMFFAYIVLRPTLSDPQMAVEGSLRLIIWNGVFRRFFPWVWLAVLGLLLSGFTLIFQVYGGMAATPGYVHVMILIGLLMFALFIYMVSIPYRQFRSLVRTLSADAARPTPNLDSNQNLPMAAAAMNRIRQVVLINLILGIIVVAIASSGRYFPIP